MARRARRHPAHRHGRCFENTALHGVARAGLGALRTDHRAKVIADDEAGCSVDLDTHYQHSVDQAQRWDYVIVLNNDGTTGIGMEDHHASPREVDTMIGKKQWAADVMATEAPAVVMQWWCWISASDEILITPNTPAAHRLAAEGIVGPWTRLRLR